LAETVGVIPHSPYRPARRRPTRYRIVVRGELSERYSTAFEGMSLLSEDGETVITGPVRDQAHLHGLLARISDLGLELVSVNAAPAPGPPDPERATRR
jgi:hypothetical protein